MAILILLVSLPTYAFASLNDYSTTENQVDVIENEENEASFAQSETYVLEEDISLREENVKHFKLSNGTVKAVSYAQPVHYMDENGKWIDIDNALTLNGNEYSAKNKQEIKFANKSGSTGTVSIKDGEYKIDFTPLNVNKVSVEITNPQENNSRKFDDVKKLSNLVSYATYANIYDGIDLEYILVGNNIKENIIVKEKQSEYTFSFEIKLSKLNAELVNNAVVLTDSTTGEQVYEIPAPYMLDASGEYSTDVEYTLTQNGKWKYTLTVTASPEWINDEGRQFPVKIDPTLNAGTAVKDLFVMEDGVYDNLESLIVGNFMGVYYDASGFIKFDTLAEISPTTILMNAKLLLHISYVENYTGKELKVGVYNAIGNWYTKNTDSGTYNINPDNISEYYDSNNPSPFEQTITESGVYAWDITDLYKGWVNEKEDEQIENHGICVKGIGLPSADDTTVSNHIASIRISTILNDNNYMIPTLEIEYRYLVGVEEYYAYAENTLGDTGKSYVNLFDGSLTYINNLTSISVGENLTYDINMVYNSIDKVWTPSFNENIKPYNGIGVEQYIWTDEDGTKHLFTPYLERIWFGAYVAYEFSSSGDITAVNDPTIFYPEDNIDYVLIQTENDELILRDYQGNQKLFDTQGRLSRICDAQGNLIFIENQLDENNQASIYTENSTSGVVLLAKISYDSDGTICCVDDIQNQKEINISWNEDKINSISYCDYRIDAEAEDTIISFYYNEILELVLDNSINQKIKYYINTNDNADSSDDKIHIEIVDVNNSQDQIKKIYIVSYGFCIDLGADFTFETNDDLSITCEFDNKGRNVTNGTIYDDNLFPNYSYYDISYNEKIYSKGYNLVKYDIGTNEVEYVWLNEENVSFDFSNVVTDSGSGSRVISDTSEDPYQMVCRIISRYDDSSIYNSTGFLVGCNTLIMSGHGLLEDVTNDGIYNPTFPTSIDIITGYYSNTDKEFLSCGVETCYIQREYYSMEENSPDRHQYDWAVCVLDENIGSELGFFNLVIPNETLINEYVKLFGYLEDEKLRLVKGQITEFQDIIECDNMLARKGMSGGPLALNNSNNLVCGILAGGYENTISARVKKIDSLIYTLVNDLNLIE